MNEPIESGDDYGERGTRSDRVRLLLLGALGILALLVEMTFGARAERTHLEQLATTHRDNWGVQRFLAHGNDVDVPPKGQRRRLLYLSNSHAMTGGRVSKHLQLLLDRACPGGHEIVDLSSGGMFAPEYLQRFSAALDYEVDGVIAAVAYISFSDRMPLSRQASSARSMFKPDVFAHLPVGFWWRNYDIGLYSNAFVAQYWRAYRYRNRLRDQWEQPLARFLNGPIASAPILFLEADEVQHWRFPDGFDRNLFQWRLYRGDRRGHLSDLQSLVDLAQVHGVPVIGLNLPVHWEKEPRPVDLKDVERYRREIREIFGRSREYRDYQDDFPKEFTTYDALHPTWHGARLHALDLALRLRNNDMFACEATEQSILAAFRDSDQPVSDAYVRALDGNYSKVVMSGFRRFDPTEPANARELLQRLSGMHVFTDGQFLHKLAVRTRYWNESDFAAYLQGTEWYEGTRRLAFDHELANARARIRYFSSELEALQAARLEAFPLPSLADASVLNEATVTALGDTPVVVTVYSLPDGRAARVLTDPGTGRAFSISMAGPAMPPYERVDVVGDGSYLQVFPNRDTETFHVPHWVTSREPLVDFGI